MVKFMKSIVMAIALLWFTLTTVIPVLFYIFS